MSARSRAKPWWGAWKRPPYVFSEPVLRVASIDATGDVTGERLRRILDSAREELWGQSILKPIVVTWLRIDHDPVLPSRP